MTSTYIKKPPFLDFEKNDLLKDIKGRPLLILGDSITTDHISPAGVIKEDSSAGKYLRDRQIKADDFNSFGDSKLKGYDGIKQSLLIALYSSLTEKRITICQEYDEFIEQCKIYRTT